MTAYQPEVIYHLAAHISVRYSVADPRADAATNVVGTLNLLNAATAADARLILASTGGAMYGDGVVRPTPEINIGTATATSVVDLLDAINAAAGTAVEPTFAAARAGESRHVALDCTRAAAELNREAATSIEAGLRRTYHQLSQNS